MAVKNAFPSKGGTKIDGIIEDYYAYAGENISAGDFVKFINGVASQTDYGNSVDTELNSVDCTGNSISAVILPNGNIFIAHSYGSGYYLYGMVCTVSGATITHGTDTQLSSVNSSGYTISSVLLPNGNVFIAHSYGTDSLLYGMVCTVNGTTITHGTDTQLDSASYTGSIISSVVLPNGNIFIAHSYGSSYYLYGMVCSISGTTISYDTDTLLSNVKYSGSCVPTLLLPNGNVFIAHSYGSSYYLYGMVCTINGTTISYGADTQLNGVAMSGLDTSTILLSNGNVFIKHRGSTSNYYLYGMVCEISGTTITHGTDTQLSSICYSSSGAISAQLSNGNVFITYGNAPDLCLCGMICSISGTVITSGVGTQLSNAAKSCSQVVMLLLSNGSIFTAHSYGSNYTLYAQIFGISDNTPTNHIVIPNYETQVQKVTSGQFNGVSKSNIIGGTATAHGGHGNIIVNQGGVA